MAHTIKLSICIYLVYIHNCKLLCQYCLVRRFYSMALYNVSILCMVGLLSINKESSTWVVCWQHPIPLFLSNLTNQFTLPPQLIYFIYTHAITLVSDKTIITATRSNCIIYAFVLIIWSI